MGKFSHATLATLKDSSTNHSPWYFCKDLRGHVYVVALAHCRSEPLVIYLSDIGCGIPSCQQRRGADAGFQFRGRQPQVIAELRPGIGIAQKPEFGMAVA